MIQIIETILVVFLFSPLVLTLLTHPILASQAQDVVISEVAWMGTAASTNDEWMELYNNTDSVIDLIGWELKAVDGTPSITLSGTVLAKSYFLLERTSDTTISDVSADQIYVGALEDGGESLELRDNNGNLIDTVNTDGGAWPVGTGGSGVPSRASMERINLVNADADSNWITNDGVTRVGLDANGNPINGTPKSPNSQGYQPTLTPTPTATPIVTSTSTPTSKPTATPKPTSQSASIKSNPSPTPSKTVSNQVTTIISPSKSKTGEVLGGSENKESTQTSQVLEPTLEPTEPTTASTLSVVAGWQQSLPKISLIFGGLLLLGSGGLIFVKKRSKVEDKSEL